MSNEVETSRQQQLSFIVTSLLDRGDELERVSRTIALWMETSALIGGPQDKLDNVYTTIAKLSIVCSRYYLAWGDYIDNQIDFGDLLRVKMEKVDFDLDIEVGIKEIDEAFTSVKNIYAQFHRIAFIIKKMEKKNDR